MIVLWHERARRRVSSRHWLQFGPRPPARWSCAGCMPGSNGAQRLWTRGRPVPVQERDAGQTIDPVLVDAVLRYFGQTEAADTLPLYETVRFGKEWDHTNLGRDLKGGLALRCEPTAVQSSQSGVPQKH